MFVKAFGSSVQGVDAITISIEVNGKVQSLSTF